jgi:AraC-like DNA-binding protein
VATGRHHTSTRDIGRSVERIVTRPRFGSSRAPDILRVAATMETSVRTLQRRLRAAGLTYSQVLQRARRAAAQRMLIDGTAAIGEIARTLGYSDPAHFTRAFQRWTGSTPRDFRDRSR